jgi:hypothetical protein
MSLHGLLFVPGGLLIIVFSVEANHTGLLQCAKYLDYVVLTRPIQCLIIYFRIRSYLSELLNVTSLDFTKEHLFEEDTHEEGSG